MGRSLLLCFGMLLALGPPLLARDRQEPNNSFDKATPTASGKALEVSIDPAKDVDYFALDVPAPGLGHIDVLVRNVPAAVAPQVGIFGPDRKPLDNTQRPTATPLFVRVQTKAPGKHFVVLRNARANAAAPQPMSLVIRYAPINQSFEPNDELAKAAAIPFGKAVQASLFPDDDQDYYKVTVPAPGHGLVTIRLFNLPPNTSPGIWILDEKGESTTVRWPRSATYATRAGASTTTHTLRETTLRIHANASGDIRFLISTRSPKSKRRTTTSRRRPTAAPYSLRVDHVPSADASEPNDEAKTATALGIGEPKTAVLFPKGDRDWFKIAVPKPGRGRLDVMVRNAPDCIAPFLTLHGPDGKKIETAQRRHGSELRYRRELAVAGDYTVEFRDGAASASGYSDSHDDAWSLKPYTIVAAFTPVPDASEPNNTHDTAKALDLNKPVEATLFPVRDADFFKFTIPPKTRGIARIRASGFNDNLVPGLRLYDAAKKELHNAAGARNRAAVLTRGLVAGDYFVQVYDTDHVDGKVHHSSNDSSSVEPYRLVVAFEPVPDTAGEPNDKLEQAEPIALGQPRKATLFPGGDSDCYKVDIPKAGPFRIQVGDFGPDIFARVNVYGPDKKRILTLNRHTPRLTLDAKAAKPGPHIVQVHPVHFGRSGQGFGPAVQFDTVPYTVLVTQSPPAAAARGGGASLPVAGKLGTGVPPAPTGIAEREPNGGTFAAQPLQAGQTVLGKLEKPGDADWFQLPITQPAHVDIALSHVPPNVDAQLVVYHRQGPAPPKAPAVLYLRGHGHYNLHAHCPDVQSTLVECNSPQGKTALANTDLMRRYDAIVVDVLHDPNHIDLASPRVQANIMAYVQGGGRFIVLTPVYAFKLFGVQLAAVNKWSRNQVVDLGVQHPLLAGVTDRRVRGWDENDAGGHFTGWREAGFTMLFAHASDPEQHAVTIAKQAGRGWLIFDTQTVGHYRNWPEADWKFRAYLGLPQMTFIGHLNDTLRHDRIGGPGCPEFVRRRIWEPGTCLIGVSAADARQASPKPYALTVNAQPITAPPPPTTRESTPSPWTAKSLTLGQGGKGKAPVALPGLRGQAWFRLEGRPFSEMSITLDNVPPNADPQLTLYQSLLGKQPLPKPKRVLYLHGERGDFHLDRHAADIDFERIEWNDARAPAILLRPEPLAAYAAIIVDAITRPTEFGLQRESVVRNIQAYVRQGGHFIVLSPMCSLKLFGVQNAEWTRWHNDSVRLAYPIHPLLANRTREHRINHWRGAEAVGYWIHTPQDGFTPLLTDWRDPFGYAITLFRQEGKGSIILDSQPLGHRDNREAVWKLYAYLGLKPALRRIGVTNNTEAAALGGGERLHIETTAAAYYLHVANRSATSPLRPLRLRVALTTAERPLEPDDTPDLAKPVALGRDAQATLYPSGDVDWRSVAVPGRGLLSLRITDLPDNIDPTLALRTARPVSKPLRVLHLEANPNNTIHPADFHGVAITRIYAFEPKAGKALDALADHDLVVLSSLSDARQFGLNRPDAHAKLRTFVQQGGRCLIVAPSGISFAENSYQMGRVHVEASSQYDAGTWHAIHASDGRKVPGQRGTGWCAGRKAKFPHTLTWTFADRARRLDRLVLYNHASSTGAQAKAIEVLVGDAPNALRSVGKFTAVASDEPQTFRFAAVSCKVVRLAIANNHGHKYETQVGEAEFHGPDSIAGFFGPTLAGGGNSSTRVTDPLHWVMTRRTRGRTDGWGSGENTGWWLGWREHGFHLVCATRNHPRRHAITLVKAIGKGWVALDTQALTHPDQAKRMAWKLHNYFDAAHADLARLDNTQKGAHGVDETADLPMTANGTLLARVADNTARGTLPRRSTRRYRFAAAFRPEDSEYEPNDTARKAVRLSSDEPATEALFPSGDVDWFQVAVERPSVMTVSVDDVSTHIDPMVEIHRAAPAAKPVKVLYLAARREAHIDRRNWGFAPVAFTRIDVGTPAEATAMDKLAGFDVVLLDGLDDARRFGMDRKATWAKIEKYAEGGGRFVVIGPLGYSLSLLARESGASVAAWNKTSTYSMTSCFPLCDGRWVARSDSMAWTSRRRSKPPHWFVFRLAGAAPPKVDRMVVYAAADTPKRRAKEIELQIAGDLDPRHPSLEALTYKSVGKFACKETAERQEFRFQAIAARHVKLIIHSNYGDTYETNLGEVELFGPGQPEGIFGLHHARCPAYGRVVTAAPEHWIVRGAAVGSALGGRSTQYGLSPVGYVSNWQAAGFEAIHVVQPPTPRIRPTPQPAPKPKAGGEGAAAKPAPKPPEPALKPAPKPKPTQAVTVCKKVGKGSIVIDCRDLGARGREAEAAGQLHAYLGLASTHVATFDNTQNERRGGSEHFRFHAQPGLYFVRISDAQFEQRRAQGVPDPVTGAPWSLDKLSINVSLEPSQNSFEPNDTPQQATWLVNAQPVRSALTPAGDVDWFRVKLPKKSPVVFEVMDVAEGLDPAVAVYSAGKFDRSLRSYSSTQNGGAGFPEAFVFTPPAAGEYYFKVSAGRYSRAKASGQPVTIRALFDDGKQSAAPRVVGAWPAAGLRNVSLAPEVVVQFDRPMSTRGLGAIEVKGAKSGTMRGKVIYDKARYQAVFTPSGGFKPSEQVTVTVASGLRGVYGGKLAKARTWSFTTMGLTAGGKPATVRLALSGGSTVGVGTATVTMKPSRRLRTAPTLKARVKGAAVAVTDVRKGERGTWTAKLTVRPNTPNGEAVFEFNAIDSRGLPVAQITEGKAFTIDTQPPPAMAGLTAAPAAGGKARLSWKRPAGVPDLGGYRLYRSARDSNRVADATLVKAVTGADFLTWDDPTPKDATWHYFVAAADRAGNVGKPSPTAKVATDRVGPTQAIADVVAKVVEKPRVDVSWKASAEAGIVGYSVFRIVKKEGEPLPKLDTLDPLTEVPTDRLSLQDFPKDNAYIYIVASRDAAGNLSPAPKPTEVVLDTQQARVAFELSAKTPLTQGDHILTAKLTEPLAADLVLSLKMPGNVVRKLVPTKKDDLNYEAKMTFTEKDIEGRVYIQPEGEDRYGNKGVRISRNSSFFIDTGPPKASVQTTPRDRVPAGKVPVRVDFYENVQDAAKLWCTVGDKRIDATIKRQHHRTFVGTITFAPDTPNGKAEWHIEATDLHKHTGGVVIRGKDFLIDTRPPEPPLNVAVKPGRGRSLMVTWTAPTAEPIAHYHLYGAADQAAKPSDATRVAKAVRDLKAAHTPKANQILWFTVTAVDRAGNESKPSKVVKGVPDVTPPPPATALEATVGDDARVHLAWTPPQANEPITYNVYRLAKPAASVAGQKPVLQTKDSTIIDNPKADGVFHYVVTVADEAGNESPPVAAKPLDYDVNPPSATVTIAPTEGTRGYRESYYVHYTIGVLAAGEKTVTLVPSEKLAQPPTLRYRTRTIDTPRDIPLTRAEGEAPGGKAAPGGLWRGKFTIPEKTDDGKLTFFFKGVDLKQNQGDVITKGKGNLFWIDTTPPDVVQAFEVASRPVGKVALSWTPPPGEGWRGVSYAVYRSAEAFKQIGDLKPLKAGLNERKFLDEPPKDGTYHYSVVATDLAGNVGRLRPSVAAVSDGTPPPAPTALEAKVKGEIVLTWKAPADEALEFRVLRNGEVVADHLTDRSFTDAPEKDAAYQYRVVATDAAGNVSKESEQAKVEFVNTLPVATIVTEPASPVRSTFRVLLTSSQPLKAAPELFLHLANGTPVRVPTEMHNGKYVGSVQVTKGTANGPAKFTFRAVSQAGHKGWRIRSGETVVIDTRPPSAGVALSPASPLKAGAVRLTLTPSEPLKETPKLSYTTMGAAAREIALTKEEKRGNVVYTGGFEVTAQDQDGVGFFSFSGIDVAGNVGSALGGARFAIDSHPPKPPTNLAAKPKRRGYVELTWRPPVYAAKETQDAIAGYNVYLSNAEIKDIGGLEPLKRRVTRIPYDVQPPSDGTHFVAVTTVDTAGHESGPSNSVSCSSKRHGPAPPRITRAVAGPATIDLAWEAGEDAKAYAVFVRVPGERKDRRVAERVEAKSFSYRPLVGGRYAVRVCAIDRFDQLSGASAASVVEFEQHAPVASLGLPGKALGRGTFAVTMQTTRPLVRAPKLRLVPNVGDPIAVTMTGAGQEWRGQLKVGDGVKGTSARFEFEGVSMVGGKEVTGRGILTGETVGLDFVAPTAKVVFVDSVARRERKVIVRAGRLRFRLQASEPLGPAPTLKFTPRGKATQTLELSKHSATEWGGVIVVDKSIGDGSGIFELQATDRQGNSSDTITENRIVDIDTTPPNRIKKIRAVPLPGGKVRVDWIPPYFDDGKLDKEANTFHLYRSESEIKDVTGLTPHCVIQRVMGFVDRPEADRAYYYAVAALDDAGNLGEISASAVAHVDKKPPAKPRDVRVNQMKTGVVHLSWKPPEGEKPLFYNVYLADHPILTTKGMTPRNPGVTWTEIYGTPGVNGVYYFAVTSVDKALNEGEPSESAMIDYKTIAPYARFFLEPDIWLHNGEYKVTLRTSKDLAEPPKVIINSEHDKKYPIAFEGEGSEWRATLKIDDTYPEGTYGFIYRGKDAEGNIGDEIQRGPLFHIDKTPTLSPGNLTIKPDDRGTPGAVVLEWRTPKKEKQQTEVPHFYNIYRAAGDTKSVDKMTLVHTFTVEYENLDEYKYTDMPPANGTYTYAVTSLDMARNESKPSNTFKVTVQSDSPRATLEFYALLDGKASPSPTDKKGVPVLGKGKVRVVVTTTSPLRAAPSLTWHFKRGDDKTKHPITLTGKGAKWQGDFPIEVDLTVIKTALFTFEGESEGGAKGTFIRKGGKVRVDTEGPKAEIIIPDAYKMLVNVKTNKLEAPPVHGGRVGVKLTTPEALAGPPALTYKLADGEKVPVPMTGFGTVWHGWMDIPESSDGQEGTFQYEGMDRAGNTSQKIAKRRYPYDLDDGLIPRKIASYATTGGRFVTDAIAPGAPTNVETEMRKLGIAVIKWKEPPGTPWTYNLYRALTPVTSTEGLKPIKTKIYATIMVDDPPVDGNYFYAVTAVDMAGNEGLVSECKSVFIDSIKPELKIKAVPSGDDFVILVDENAPPQLSLTINFPGKGPTRVELGGSSGELKKYTVRSMPGGGRGIVLPQMAEFFNGRVEIVVHSPDPDGNIVEEKTEVEMKKISTATGGEVESVDQQVELIIPPGIEPVIPKGPNEVKRIGGYENLFFIQYANIPDKKPKVAEGERRRRDDVDPIPPGLEVVGRPYRIELNQPPKEPMQLKASASQADFSQLTQLTAKLKMKIPTQYSEAVEDPEYLKGRLKVIKWVPALDPEDADQGHWESVPDIEVDVKNKQIITPATDITTYVIVSERTPPSVRDLVPERGGAVSTYRPEISCLIVDKGTGVAVGAENRIVLSIDGKKIEEKLLAISKGDPTEVRVTYKVPEDLKPGSHIVGVRAEDVVENVANVKWQFTIDDEPPEFLSVSPKEKQRLPVARPIIQARIRDEGGIAPDRIEASIDGSRLPDDAVSWQEATGLLTCTLGDDLPSGTHQALLVVRDKAGAEVRKAWAFRTDLEAPQVALIHPAPDSSVAPDTAKVAFVVQDLFGRATILDLRIDDVRVGRADGPKAKGYTFDEEKGELAYTAPKPFTLGDRRVSVLFADDLGNAATRTWTFRCKEGAPAAVAWKAPVKTPKFEAVKSTYASVAVRVDTERLAQYAPDVVPAVSTLVEEAEELEDANKFDASAAKYSEAAKKLSAASDKASETVKQEQAKKATAALDIAKKAYAEQGAKVDRKVMKRHAPDALQAADALAKQAEGLAKDGRLDESAEKYTMAAAELAASSGDTAKAEEARAIREAEKRQKAAKAKHASLADSVDAKRIEKFAPEALAKAAKLASQGEALAEQSKLVESAAAYEQAAQTLTEAEKQAEQLEQAAAAAALKAKHEAAAKRYAEVAARVDKARIGKHVPDALPAATALAREAEALGRDNKLPESTAKFVEAADRLVAADTQAERLDREARFGAVAKQHDEAKRAFDQLNASADVATITRHAPDALAKVRTLTREAEALAAQQKLAESLQKYTEAKATLAAAATAAVTARRETAKKQCADLAATVDRARIRKHVPDALPAVADLVRRAVQLADQGKPAESAAAYEQAHAALSAADRKAQELDRAAIGDATAQLQAAKAAYVKATQAINAQLIIKHQPAAFPAIQRLLGEADALAKAGKHAESAAKYDTARTTLVAAERKAKDLAAAPPPPVKPTPPTTPPVKPTPPVQPAPDAQFQAARAAYVKTANSVDAAKIARHSPNTFPTIRRLLDEAAALGNAGRHAEGAAKYQQATDTLTAASRAAQTPAPTPPTANAAAEYRTATDRYVALTRTVDAKRITTHMPNVFPAIRRLLDEAAALVKANKLHDATTKVAAATRMLAEADKATKTPDPAFVEMQAIDTILEKGNPNAAVPRICTTLVTAWKAHRRTNWATLLKWLQQRRQSHPAMELAGRNQLDVAEQQLRTYVRQEAAWDALRKRLEQTPDLNIKIQRVESFLLYNHGSLYYGDAENLRHTLRVQLQREQGRKR